MDSEDHESGDKMQPTDQDLPGVLADVTSSMLLKTIIYIKPIVGLMTALSLKTYPHQVPRAFISTEIINFYPMTKQD